MRVGDVVRLKGTDSLFRVTGLLMDNRARALPISNINKWGEGSYVAGREIFTVVPQTIEDIVGLL